MVVSEAQVHIRNTHGTTSKCSLSILSDMGKFYDNPDGIGYVTVHEPDSRADRPPTGEEGYISRVDFEYYNVTAGPEQWLRCQVCPTTFRWREPHVRARLALEDVIGRRSVDAVFCSREYWYEWATYGCFG